MPGSTAGRCSSGSQRVVGAAGGPDRPATSTAGAPESDTRNSRRASGRSGSSGRYTAPALRTARAPVTSSTNRWASTPTATPGAAPARRRRCAHRSASASSSAYVTWLPSASATTATASGGAPHLLGDQPVQRDGDGVGRRRVVELLDDPAAFASGEQGQPSHPGGGLRQRGLEERPQVPGDQAGAAAAGHPRPMLQVGGRPVRPAHHLQVQLRRRGGVERRPVHRGRQLRRP